MSVRKVKKKHNEGRIIVEKVGGGAGNERKGELKSRQVKDWMKEERKASVGAGRKIGKSIGKMKRIEEGRRRQSKRTG